MRKFLLSAITLLGVVGAARADAVFDFTAPATLNPAYPEAITAETYESLGATEDKTSSGINYYFSVDQVAFTNGNVKVTPRHVSGDNPPRLYYQYSGAVQLRAYKSATFVVETTDGSSLTEIAITGSNLTSNYITSVSTGTYSTGKWTGNASSVEITVGVSTVKFQTLTITTAVDDPTAAPAAPTFSLAEGKYYDPQTVGISAADDSDIYYTTDGSDPTTGSTKYAGPVEIAVTTTLKAIAVRDGKTSEVAAATYTIAERQTISTVADILKLEDGTQLVVGCDLTVGWCSSRNVFATDGNAFIQVYPAVAPGFEQGTVIKAGWIGTYKLYFDTPEIVPVGDFTPTTEAGTFVAPVVAASQIGIDYVNYVLTLQKVTFTEATPATRSNWTVTVDGVELTFRNNYTLESQPAGTYDVTAVVSVYNSAAQLYPIAYAAPGSSAGIAELDAIDPTVPCEYYNLLGVRVAAENARGLLIVRQGNRAAKVVK